ncbi:FadR/GntR family transcriptional regulator [Streptomyces sp. NRRL F-5126]|uniref:FadR/GntR family transcriptional regulator n=1 Tax=Streptomyces sp. NRRL F-5126 TaxID=1463857 RepID=UPI0004C9697E|nr:FCD domain-containing protein [Streptomyces sp. NRRL F-5126]
MTDSLRPVARTRLYEQVMERLREFVEQEAMHAGDRLPPERDLAERLDVSRTSVRQAIVALEVQGLVEARHGGGTYLLRDRLDAEPLETMIDRRRRLPDILDARDALETKLAALAADRHTAADVAAIDAALAEMAEAVERGELCAAEDQRFHGAVTAAAHSPLLADFMAEIAQPIAESRTESLRQPGRPAQSLKQHRRIAAAVRAGDADAAAAAMHHHVAAVGHVKLLGWHDETDG